MKYSNNANKNKNSEKKTKKSIFQIILISAISILIVFFILYSIWFPSSQILGETIYKNENDSVILTFDDGPGENTEDIVDFLNYKNITAIFFITCTHINDSEIDLIKKMSSNGNTIALHGYSHKKFQGYNELNYCKQILENITGKEVVYFRPPYGFKSPNTMSAAKKLNLTVMTWSLFPRDYSAKNPEKIIKRVKRNLKKNSIICLHDGPSERENTEQALPEIIRIINEK